MEAEEKRAAYACDVTYVTNQQLGSLPASKPLNYPRALGVQGSKFVAKTLV